MKTEKIPVVVLLQQVAVKNNAWIDHKWQAVGVLPTKNTTEKTPGEVLVSNINSEPIYQYNGLAIEFDTHELDSYYQNLIGKGAAIFIICNATDDRPKPFLITLSYDEAAIYMETDEIVFTATINAEIYQAIEEFVLENYHPEKRKKRKLKGGTAGSHYQKASVYE